MYVAWRGRTKQLAIDKKVIMADAGSSKSVLLTGTLPSNRSSTNLMRQISKKDQGELIYFYSYEFDTTSFNFETIQIPTDYKPKAIAIANSSVYYLSG